MNRLTRANNNQHSSRSANWAIIMDKTNTKVTVSSLFPLTSRTVVQSIHLMCVQMKSTWVPECVFLLGKCKTYWYCRWARRALTVTSSSTLSQVKVQGEHDAKGSDWRESERGGGLSPGKKSMHGRWWVSFSISHHDSCSRWPETVPL